MACGTMTGVVQAQHADIEGAIGNGTTTQIPETEEATNDNVVISPPDVMASSQQQATEAPVATAAAPTMQVVIGEEAAETNDDTTAPATETDTAHTQHEHRERARQDAIVMALTNATHLADGAQWRKVAQREKEDLFAEIKATRSATTQLRIPTITSVMVNWNGSHAWWEQFKQRCGPTWDAFAAAKPDEVIIQEIHCPLTKLDTMQIHMQSALNQLTDWEYEQLLDSGQPIAEDWVMQNSWTVHIAPFLLGGGGQARAGTAYAHRKWMPRKVYRGISPSGKPIDTPRSAWQQEGRIMFVEAIGAHELDDLIIGYIPNTAVGETRLGEFQAVLSDLARLEGYRQHHHPERRHHRMLDSNYSHADERWMYDSSRDANEMIANGKDHGNIPGVREIETRTAIQLLGVDNTQINQAGDSRGATDNMYGPGMTDITRLARHMRNETRPTCAIEVAQQARRRISVGVCLDRVQMVSSSSHYKENILARPGWWGRHPHTQATALAQSIYLHLWYQRFEPRNSMAQNHNTDHAMIWMTRTRYPANPNKTRIWATLRIVHHHMLRTAAEEISRFQDCGDAIEAAGRAMLHRDKALAREHVIRSLERGTRQKDRQSE